MDAESKRKSPAIFMNYEIELNIKQKLQHIKPHTFSLLAATLVACLLLVSQLFDWT